MEEVDAKVEVDGGAADTNQNENDYFASYENIDIHRIMLQDEVRTNAYMDAIYQARDLFKDKVVMDVGAGTGILSLFCAKAGAKKVYSVEYTNLAKIIPSVVEKNNFESIIEVIHSKVENIEKEIQVDILVSEWMGFYLIHESMLGSVLYARDKFLKPDGQLFPNSAQVNDNILLSFDKNEFVVSHTFYLPKLYAAPCHVPELWKNQSDFWMESKYGFDLSAFGDVAKIKSKPEIYSFKEGTDLLLTDPQLLWDFNLKTIKPSSLKELKDKRFFSIEEDSDMHAVCIWFTCTFPSIPNDSTDGVILSTAPWDKATHWNQTIILFPESTQVEAGDIFGWELELHSDKLNERFYKISISILDGDCDHPTDPPCNCGSVKCEIIKHYLLTSESSTKP